MTRRFYSFPSVLSRALGLSILEIGIVAIFSSCLPHVGGTEEKKVAVSKSRSRAALRCCVHLVPVVPSLALAYLNLHGYYIGSELSGPSGEDSARFGALQFAAKMHELSINASIAAMVYSYIRQQLTLGMGLPFGALVAGQRFTELSYLWSVDLWGALFSQKAGYSLRWKVGLGAVVATAIFLAATAAPSSAIAIIPRLDMWPCCGTSFWINASNETLWPSTLNGSYTGGDNCLVLGATENASCPSGGVPTMRSYAPFLTDRSLANVPPGTILMYGEKRIRSMNTTWQIGRNPSIHSTATSPMSVITDALGLADWGLVAARYSYFRPNGDRSKSRYWSQRDFLTQVEAMQPITRVKCTSSLERADDDSSDVLFPDQQGNSILASGSGKNRIWGIADLPSQGNVEYPRLSFQELSPSVFRDSTMGAIVILPVAGNATKTPFITCNIDSRWAPGIISICGWGVYCSTPIDITEYGLGTVLQDWPWQSITSDLSWASALDPPVVHLNKTVSAFSAIASSAGISAEQSPFYQPIIEGLLAMMFTDALARLGTGATLQGTLKDAGSDSFPADGKWVDEWMRHGNAFSINSTANETEHWAPLRMKTLVNGYAYGANELTVKLAVSVLIIHAALALAHTLYEVLLSGGLSSSSWDSVAELVALAMNSQPTEKLRNTCAGIRRLGTMGKVVRVVATAEREGEEWRREADHLELWFEDSEGVEEGDDDDIDDERKESPGLVETNKAYGSLASTFGVTAPGRTKLRKRTAAERGK